MIIKTKPLKRKGQNKRVVEFNISDYKGKRRQRKGQLKLGETQCNIIGQSWKVLQLFPTAEFTVIAKNYPYIYLNSG